MLLRTNGYGSKFNHQGPLVLVYVSIYQGSILGPIFDPQPNCFLLHWVQTHTHTRTQTLASIGATGESELPVVRLRSSRQRDVD